GHDIERWLLKTLCALVFSGNACSAIGPAANWRPNPLWLSVLFLDQQLPVNWGLYWSSRVTGSEKTFEYSVLSNEIDGIYGLVATFRGLQVMPAMGHPRQPGAELLKDCV